MIGFTLILIVFFTVTSVVDLNSQDASAQVESGVVNQISIMAKTSSDIDNPNRVVRDLASKDSK